MTVRSQRHYLWLITGILCFASFSLLAANLLKPVSLAEISFETVESNSSSGAPESASTYVVIPLPPLKSFTELASRNFRQRLFDPPPPAPPPKKEPPPLPSFRLVGTVLNSSRPLAMISDARNHVTLKTLGDHIGPDQNQAVILTIEANSITLKHAGRTITVKKE